MSQAWHRFWWIPAWSVYVFLQADWVLATSNRTIDDADPLVIYSPSDQWSQGSTCKGCRVKLDPSQTFDRTWHDTSHKTTDSEPRSLQVQFTGTAVYVFNVLANAVPDIATTTSLQFTLDGAEDGSFLHTPSDSPDPDFNVLVYSRDGLSNTEHTLQMQATESPDSVILFDYIEYTVPEEGPLDPGSAPVTTTITSISSDQITTTITSTTTSIEAVTSSDGGFIQSSRSPPSSRNSSSSTSMVLSTTSHPPASSSTSSSSTSSTAVVTSSPHSASSSATPLNSTVRSSTNPIGLIVGATIGGIGVLAFIAALILVLRRRSSKRPPSPNEFAAEKGDGGESTPDTARDDSDPAQRLTQIPESGSSVLLIGDQDHPPASSSGMQTRLTSWVSSESSYSSAPSSPMRVPSISDMPIYYSAPEFRESAMASSLVLVPSRAPSQKSPTSPFTSRVRALPPLPHEKTVSSVTPTATYRSSTVDSSMFAQLVALQEEVDEYIRRQPDAPPRYDQA